MACRRRKGRSARRLSRIASFACALIAAFASLPARCIVAPKPAAPAAARLRSPPRVLQDASGASSRALAEMDPGFVKLVADAGGEWHARTDLRTGRVALAWGSGLPLGAWPVPREEALDRAVGDARAFLVARADLFRVPPGVELVLDRRASVALEGGRLVQVVFRAEVGGVPVEGAGVTLRVHSGRLVQLGIARVGDALADVDPKPRVEPREALLIARASLALALPDSGRASVSMVEAPTLLVLPWIDGDPALSYRLAWRLAFRVAGGAATWVAHVDARDGAVLGLADGNLYACPVPPSASARVLGAVQVGVAEESPIVARGLPSIAVAQGSGMVDADLDGSFLPDAAGSASADLAGGGIVVACMDCERPPRARVVAPLAGDLDFGSGGAGTVGNGRSTLAERNAYYHLQLVNRLAAAYLDDAAVGGFFSRGQLGMVNVAETCNGFASYGSTYYLREDPSCRNPAEVPDVVYHEWGHSLDLATLAGTFDWARTEGMADTTAFLATHDPRIAPHFFLSMPDGLRYPDEDLAGYVATASGVPSDCGTGGQGPLGGEPHCEGQVFAQAHWHLGELLRAALGEAAGWHELERLFFLSLPLSDTYVPDQTDSAYDAVVFVDDDDTDLTNGTPHGAEIAAAFGHHEMASTPLVRDSRSCTRPPAPVLDARLVPNVATGVDDAVLSWTTSPLHASYDVYRNEGTGTDAFLRVARVDAPTSSWVDAGLLGGVTMAYQVAAIGTAACRSDDSAVVTLAPAATPRIALASSIVVDVGGDGDGRLDRGERALVVVTLENAGDVDLAPGTATLSTQHPGVLVRRASASLPALPRGAIASTVAPHFEVIVSTLGVSCGEAVAFEVLVEAPEGCARASFALVVGDDGRATLLADDFEADDGWRVDAAGTDDATGGLWERGTPSATWRELQSGSDHSTPGTQCWTTGNLAGADVSELADDDVEAGCTSVTSRAFALAGERGLEASYWIRRIMGAGDVFTVEASVDGGTRWATIDVVTGVSPSWERRVVDLESALGGAVASLTLRFTACDRGDDSTCEVAFDDLAIERRIEGCGCDLVGPPPPAGAVLFATGSYDDDGVEFSWSVPLTPEQHLRLARGTSPQALSTVVTPAGFTGSRWDDRLAPGALYFYSLRIADCLGDVGGD